MEKLRYGLVPHESGKADLVPDFDQLVLVGYFVDQMILDLNLDFILFNLIHLRAIFELFLHNLVHKFVHGASCAVYGFHFVDKKFDEHAHDLLIFDHQINIRAAAHLESDAVPRVEGRIFA